jgi:hypothetical protein
MPYVAAALPAIDAEHRSHGVMSAQRTGPTVHSQLTRWRKDGTLQRMHDRLREHAREKEGRDREPSAAIVDSQTARAAGTGGPDRGFDAAKKTFGRKRHILVDVSGLILLTHIHAASLHDTVGARQMVKAAPMAALPRLELVWADGAYTGPFATWLEKERGWHMEVPFHRQRQAWRYGLEERPADFNVLPRRPRRSAGRRPFGKRIIRLLADDGWWSGPSPGSRAHAVSPETTSGCLKPAWR